MTTLSNFKNSLSKIDWVLTEARHVQDLVAGGSDANKLLLADEPPDSVKDAGVTELRVWAPANDKLMSVPARLAALTRLRCLAIGPGVDPKTISSLDQNLIPSTVTALGVFTSGLPAKWPAAVCLPNVVDLRTDGPMSFTHANFPNLRAVSVYPERNGKNLDAVLACKLLDELQLLTVSDSDMFARIEHLPLTKLGLLGGKLATLEGIERLGGIKWLRLHNLRWLTSISAIKALSRLEELELRYCRQIEDIAVVADLPRLRRLEVIACGNVGLKKMQIFIDKLKQSRISASS